MDKVCNGFNDCPGGEDEKKCTALIDEPEEGIAKLRIDPISTENLSKNRSVKESHLDRAIESSITDTTTLYSLPEDLQSEKLINARNSLSPKSTNEEAARNRNAEESKVVVAVSSREISSNVLRNGLTPGNSFKDNGTFPVAHVYSKEIDDYNNYGYLSIRKNGIWGKLCLADTNSLIQERHARRITWSIEDLAKAACKAITYQ